MKIHYFFKEIAVFSAVFGKMGVFRQKTVARMDGPSPGGEGCADDPVFV